MTENQTLENYLKAFYTAFYSLTIGVTSGFGILFLLVQTGDPVLYSLFWSFALGSGLAFVFGITNMRNINLRRKLEGENLDG